MKKGLIHSISLASVKCGETIGIRSIGLVGSVGKGSVTKPAFVLERLFGLLLENGKRILVEKQGTKVYPMSPALHSPAISLENGFSLLNESGGKISLETE